MKYLEKYTFFDYLLSLFPYAYINPMIVKSKIFFI